MPFEKIIKHYKNDPKIVIKNPNDLIVAHTINHL